MPNNFLVTLVFILTAVSNLDALAARPAPQIKKAAMADSSWKARLLKQAMTWGSIVLFSTSVITSNVPAQEQRTTRPRRSPRIVGHHSARQSLAELLKEQLTDNVPGGVVHTDIEKLLASGKLDINAKDMWGDTALHVVAQDFYADNYDDFKLTKLILAHGADPNLKNYARKTPLDYALDSYFCCVDRKAVEMAQLLVAAGADINEVIYSDRASRGLAIHNILEAATVLITDRQAFVTLLAKEEGGMAKVVQEKGEYLLKLAAEWSNAVVVEVLLDHGVAANVGMFGAALSQQHEQPRQKVLNVLLSRGADINVKDAEQGGTPLHVATTANNLRNVEILLAHHADPNLTDTSGQTPLHYSVLPDGNMNDLQLVAILLAHGAEANVKDNTGRTPYDYAVKNYTQATAIDKPVAAAIASILLHAMHGMASKDAQGRTSAYWAKLSGIAVVQSLSNGNMEIAQLGDKAIRQQIIIEYLKAIDLRLVEKTGQ